MRIGIADMVCCCYWCFYFLFFSILKKIDRKTVSIENNERKKKINFHRIIFNDVNMMFMTKINVTKNNIHTYMLCETWVWVCCEQNWQRSRKKNLRWQISMLFIAVWTVNENSLFFFSFLSTALEIVIYDIFMHVDGSSFSLPIQSILIIKTSHFFSIYPQHVIPCWYLCLCCCFFMILLFIA